MKTLTFFLLALLIGCFAHSQELDGEWKGTSLISVPRLNQSFSSQIKLYFQHTNDSAYTVYSYCKGYDSKGRDTIVVARLIYKKISEKTINMEEAEILMPKDPSRNCLLIYDLQITKVNGEIVLKGNLTSHQKGCDLSGKISFRRSTK